MKNLLLFICCFVLTISSYAQKELWGMTSDGGVNNGGVIFKTDGSGNNLSLEHIISRYDGDYPKADLIKASDGNFYGVTSACCLFNGQSVLFQYDPANSVYTKKYAFNVEINGTKSYGSLMQASNGKIYGMTSTGGAHGDGVIFQYDILTSTYTKQCDFDSTNGSVPEGSLIQAPDGKLYGMTLKGGANDLGVLFQFDIVTHTISKKIDFGGTEKGSGPQGSLILTADGKLYGMTSSGGVNDFGIIFQFDPSSSNYKKLFDFDGTNTGSSPGGSLIKGADGTLYGLATYGGTMDRGMLFQFDPSGPAPKYTKKFEFDSLADGGNPWGSLLLAADGNLYGMTQMGGANNAGVIFEYDLSTPAGSYHKKFDFSQSSGGHTSGSLIQYVDGTFYGMTNDGGIDNVGVLFQFNSSNSQYSKKLDFHFAPDGSFPVGALMQTSDGMLYGAARDGGAKNCGVLFQYDQNVHAYKRRFDFDTISGRSPSGSFIQTADGKLYGMTTYGGTMDLGVLFQYDAVHSTYTKIIDFDGTNKGSNPWGSLLLATDGKLYGMTQSGGANDLGVIFSYDPSGSGSSAFTRIFDFDGASGKLPEGSLVQGKDGALYGMANQGGANDFGVLFKYDFSASVPYMKVLDFDGSNGAYPVGSLTRAADDNLYGTTNQGGANDMGVLFQYKPGSAGTGYNKEFDFNGPGNGSFPNGSILQASDGKLYGLAPSGGKNNMGVLFQFDPSNSGTCVTKFDFDGKNGMDPDRISLIEIASTNSIFDPGPLAKDIHAFPNPSSGNMMVLLDQKVTNASLKLFTVTGQMVLSRENVSGDRLPLNISGQPKGVYFMEIMENGSISRVKIVKD